MLNTFLFNSVSCLKITGAKRKQLHYFGNGTEGMTTSRCKHIIILDSLVLK
jgi:hypothetical protein